MLRVKLTLGPALHFLQTLDSRLARPAELLAPAVPVVEAAIQRNFDQQGRPLPWAPLSPRYRQRKQRRFPGRRILERTGRLRRSIRTRVQGSLSAQAGAIVASTDLPYAAAHQFGLLQRNLPARPFLLLTDSDREEVVAAILRGLEDTEHRSASTAHRP